jgi:hypothetical protein
MGVQKPYPLYQLPIKRTTRDFLKVLRSNTFKKSLGLRAKHCSYLDDEATDMIAWILIGLLMKSSIPASKQA